jgi:hypothetical protein
MSRPRATPPNRSRGSGVQRGERVVDQAINLDAFAQQALAAAKRTLSGDADFIYPGLGGMLLMRSTSPLTSRLNCSSGTRRSGLNTTNR